MHRILNLLKETQKPVEMIYLSKNGNITQRTILVLKVTEKNVTAYCYLRKKNRYFLIENILSFHPVKQKYKTNAI
ncbi:hypothetical protein [Sutcliffiella rhizosphaerae]|uniref:WYL domain-containing protein n=1 Tax=Sutcliffiella rhizosphaerae TaxID=2880967 RepID=A0ABM8YKV6_9BACI|nr:hypothetical protein [Sutcliffiella rhizosphaerae]CAG9620486.1 hypothetical protein BACCIP111883_01254 [Sutcliffiella rhizosphaerae]